MVECPMLNERAQILLKTLVERYIGDGQPVGSRALQQYSGLEISPATIRNVMADLEDIGLVSSPHTSAGRIPTGLAYRLFIDTMLVTKPLDSVREALNAWYAAHPDQLQRPVIETIWFELVVPGLQQAK